MHRAAILLLSCLVAAPVAADTFVVDSSFDDPDQAPGDGNCDSTRGSTCTLRAAIEEAEALAGADIIEFSIGTSTIVPLTPFPEINRDLVIDGTTSPDYAPTGPRPLEAPPAIFLDGIFLSGSTDDGLSARGTSVNPIHVEVRGLGIVRFPRYGIDVTFAEAAWIESNWIGVARDTQSTATGNGSHGLLLSACSDCIVGAVVATLFDVPILLGRGNAIANNDGDGVVSGLGSGNRFGGNEIGVLPSLPLGTYHGGANAGRGISLLDSGDTVGYLEGSADGRNFIGFNGSDGVYSGGPSTTVDHNTIVQNLGNGILLLGDGSAITSNAIRNNGGHGLQVGSAASATDDAVVSGNTMGDNGGRGIDLQNGSGALLEDNSIYLNDNDGVRVDGDGNLVRGNHLGIRGATFMGGNAFNGIAVAGDDNDLVDNEIVDTPGDGIDISGLRTTVSGNSIGVSHSGAIRFGNSTGIRVHSVALATDVLGNVVVGTSGDGMVLAADGVLACGNRVGLLGDGTALGNTGAGMRVLGDGGFIGRYPALPAICAGGGNRVANNWSDGIVVEGSGTLVAENLIEDQGLGGLFVGAGAANTQVLDNLFAGNAQSSLRIAASAGNGNRAGPNVFAAEADIPVDLGDDGATANDAADADSGTNRLMNHPEMVALFARGSTVDVTYRLDIAAGNASFPLEVEFYLVLTEAGGSRSYQPLGSASFDAAPLTQQTASVLLPEGVDAGAIAAMVVDAGGSSSEIGAARDFTTPVDGPALFSDGFED